MATYTYQIRDTVYPTDAAAIGTTGSLRVTQDFISVDAEVGLLRVTQDFLNVDAEIGPLRVTQLALMADGLFPVPIRATQETISVDLTGGTRRATQLVISVDVPDWLLNRTDVLPLYDTVVATKIVAPHEQTVYTCVATDGLLLADWATPQATWAPRWDFWGEADYYREVAALMRVESFGLYRV